MSPTARLGLAEADAAVIAAYCDSSGEDFAEALFDVLDVVIRHANGGAYSHGPRPSSQETEI